VCGGHDHLARGKGIRCFGYLDGTAAYARCTREERAGGLPRNADGTYSHRLIATCRCGQAHGSAGEPGGNGAAYSSTRTREKRFRSFFSLLAFLRKRYGEGTRIRHWIYCDASGREAFRVLRIDYPAPDGRVAKSYRPCHLATDGKWHFSRPDGMLPLYRLPSIIDAPADAIITLLEGEKCADLAASLGLSHATTSAHGAAAPRLTDWSPLAGRSVAILPDAGASGADYVARVAAILDALDPPASVRVVCLPGLDDGDDIEQWIDNHRASGIGDDVILAELQSLIVPSA